MHLEHSIDINRTPDEVFAFLAHHPNHVRFIEENVSCEQVTAGPMGVGTRVKNVARVFGRQMEEHFEIVAFDPPRVLHKASREGSSFETTDRFELTPLGEGTRVRAVVTACPRGLGERAIIALMTPVVGRSMRRMLASLRSLLEQGTAAPVPSPPTPGPEGTSAP